MQVNIKDYRRGYMREYMQKYREKYKKEPSLNGSLRKDSKSRIMYEARLGGCIICKEMETCCLHLHHVDPSKKSFSFPGFGKITPEELKSEIAKCVVLCANCHSKVHAGIIDVTEKL